MRRYPPITRLKKAILGRMIVMMEWIYHNTEELDLP
jgi:hypothetical protein